MRKFLVKDMFSDENSKPAAQIAGRIWITTV